MGLCRDLEKFRTLPFYIDPGTSKNPNLSSYVWALVLRKNPSYLSYGHETCVCCRDLDGNFLCFGSLSLPSFLSHSLTLSSSLSLLGFMWLQWLPLFILLFYTQITPTFTLPPPVNLPLSVSLLLALSFFQVPRPMYI